MRQPLASVVAVLLGSFALATSLAAVARADGPGVPVAPPAPAAPSKPDAPADDPRKAWIDEQTAKIRTAADAATRKVAIDALLAQDWKGDCVVALGVLALEAKKDKSPDLRVAIVRALGRPGLDAAVPTLLGLIEDKDDDVRSNVYVSLEYVGSPTAVDALTKRLGKEKDDARYDNVCRALGRCGVRQDAVRKTLVHEMNGAKSDRAIAGPVIGLTYFEKDAEVARAIEKAAGKEGERVKKSFLLWALTEIRDPKSAEFVKKEILPKETVALAIAYDNAIYTVLAGLDDGSAGLVVTQGMGWVLKQVGGIADAARRGRDGAGFVPKGEFAGEK